MTPMIPTEIDRLFNTLESGEVLRYHAAPGVTKQSDAQHQWGVAVLCLFIRPTAGRDLLIECLTHDTGELVVGDIPYTAKKDNAAFGFAAHSLEQHAREELMLGANDSLEKGETALLKVCDTLEGLLWCSHQEVPVNHCVRGLHRGQVLTRWADAYLAARERFRAVLPPWEWLRADAIYTRVTGTPLTPLDL